MNITVRRLERGDDRSGFQSGTIELDRFFQLYAGQNQFRHHLGTTYIAVEGGDEVSAASKLVGFVTVAPSEIAPPTTSQKKRRAYPLPVLRIARLAVDSRAQGRGIGGVLLRAVFGLAVKMSEELGCVGVVVDAKPEAVGFYEKLGFIPLEMVSGALGDRPQPTPMFLEVGQLR